MEHPERGNRGIAGKMSFDRPRSAASLRSKMAMLKTFLQWRLSAGCCLLLAVNASVGEKVRFGPPSGALLQTQPERSASETISLQSTVGLNQPNAVATPRPVAPTPAVPSRRTEAEDQDQRNWIFRDTRNPAAMQKALGVDTYESAKPKVGEQDSVAVIQDYFSRQRSQATDHPAGGKASPAASWGGQLGKTPGTLGIGGVNADTSIGSASTLSDPLFRNTLNADNPSVRRYFRDLYASPNSPAAGPAANSPAPLANGPQVETANSATRSPSFQDLANRAAFVNSLTPNAPLSTALNPSAPAAQPTVQDRSEATVNQGKLFERRNGLIEIPSRKF